MVSRKRLSDFTVKIVASRLSLPCTGSLSAKQIFKTPVLSVQNFLSTNYKEITAFWKQICMLKSIFFQE